MKARPLTVKFFLTLVLPTLTALLALTLLACQPRKSLKVAVLLRLDSQENDYYRLMARGVQQQLALLASTRESSAQVSYLIGQNDAHSQTQDLITQQRQALQQAIESGVQAILLTPEDDIALADLLLQARHRGIKTVSLHGVIPGVDASVGRKLDLPELVRQLGEKNLQGSLVIAGGPNLPMYNNLSRNVIDGLARPLPDLKPLGDNYNFGPVIWRSRSYTFNFLMVAPDLALMVALDDHIGRANMAAISERNRQQSVSLLSFGGSQALLAQAADYPGFLGLLKLDPQRTGAVALRMAYLLVHRPQKLTRSQVELPTPFQPLAQAKSWDYPFPAQGYPLP